MEAKETVAAEKGLGGKGSGGGDSSSALLVPEHLGNRVLDSVQDFVSCKHRW